MKKTLAYIFLIISISLVGSVNVHASEKNPTEQCVYTSNPEIPDNAPCGAPKCDGESCYTFLAPLPGLGKTFDTTNKENNPALGNYLNTLVKLFIGICAVLAVVMIVLGGIEYMGNDVISHKSEGIEKIKGAIFGLILALASFLILQEINPDLLNTSFDIKTVKLTVNLQEFVIPASYTKSGSGSIKVDFKQEACPAAKAAQAATGVDKDFILAIFSQETAGGANTGGCKPANANMYPEDIAALERIVGKQNVATTNVSCASGGGHGGAIGLMQFRPTTWLSTRDNANRDPWNVNDALTVAGILLKKNGAINNPKDAACKYYSGDACQPGRNPPNEFYGNEVMARMNYIKQKNACP